MEPCCKDDWDWTDECFALLHTLMFTKHESHYTWITIMLEQVMTPMKGRNIEAIWHCRSYCVNLWPYTVCFQDQEEQAFFAVFDGHGGVDAAIYAANHLHVNMVHQECFSQDPGEALCRAFRVTDERFIRKAKMEVRAQTLATLILKVSFQYYWYCRTAERQG